jgi:putative ABC transport system permease protein
VTALPAAAGFFGVYLRRELRRRTRQTVVTALGLAVGIGLVVTVTAASAGVRDAQTSVLHALFGIGTDVTVTTAAPPPPKPGAPGAGSFGFVVGDKPHQEDHLGVAPGLGLLDASAAAAAARLPGVAAAAGGLTLLDTTVTVPSKRQVAALNGRPLPAPTTSTVGGVDLAHPGLGPYASGALSAGRGFTAADAAADVVVLDDSYAAARRLKVGSTTTLGGTRFTVIGLVRQPRGGGAANAYLPLPRAQALAEFHGLGSLRGKVTTIYLAARSAADIAAVQQEVAGLLPSATVTSSASLAAAVSGSLASATDLAGQLGRWLAVLALVAAFAVAALLTLAAVGRRVREFGTLKALGWRSRRIVGQLVGESTVTGLLGAAAGIALGYAGAGIIRLLAPTLSATVAQNPGSPPPENVSINGAGLQRHLAEGSTNTVAVHLTAPVTLAAIGLAVALAVTGGLLTGAIGGWRAARLRPTEALGRVG